MSAFPLYAFGYGLSYTTFEYSDLRLIQKAPYCFDVSFKVKNTGKYDGEEVAQLYVRDEYASIVQPIKQLKRFERLFLKQGEERTVTFSLAKGELSIINQNLEEVVESGIFQIMVGRSSDDILLKDSISIE